MFLTLVYFFLALLLLVIVHEYGHFCMARFFQVKVIRFSFGFGKVLARWRDKKGTEYVWSLVPLGGYVKMLDESEAEVPMDERHLAFNNQSLWVRSAIVIAGPLFNFLFAFVALWLVLVIGMHTLAPIADEIKPGSIAAKAGMLAKVEILSLNGKKISSWRDFQYAFMPLMGASSTVPMVVQSMADHHTQKLSLSLANWQLDSKHPDLLASLGIVPFIPTIPPVIGEVLPDTPAQMAGLQVNDTIFSVNGQRITDWLKLVDFVKQHPKKRIAVVVKRHGKLQPYDILTGYTMNNGQLEGSLGVRSKPTTWPPQWLRLQRESPVKALGTAFTETWDLTGATVTLMGRLITGALSIRHLSGPVGIAKGAGESGRSGFVYYLSFLALISISLGVLNLLPIPMLDGGYLLYFVFEMIRGRPLSKEVKSVATYLGLVFLLVVTIVAFTNDVMAIEMWQ